MFVSLPSLMTKFWQTFLDTKEIMNWLYREHADPQVLQLYRQIMFWNGVNKFFELSAPLIMGYWIAALIAKDGQMVVWALLATMITKILMSLTEWRVGIFIEPFLGRFMLNLEDRINRRFFEKELGLHVEENVLLCSSVMNRGRANAENVVRTIVFMVTDSLMTMIVTFVILVALCPSASVIASLTIVATVIISAGLNAYIATCSEEVDAEARALNRYRQERWDAVERVITANQVEVEINIMNERAQKNMLKENGMWLQYINYAQLRPVANLTGYAAVAALGSYQVLNGTMDMPRFLSVITWTHILTTQIRMLARAEREISKNVPGIITLRQALELPKKVKEVRDPRVIHDHERIGIRFEQVSYSYRGGEGVITNMSFSVKAGERVALIGSSGAGKSTAVRLLQRYMDPAKGQVLVNGVNLRQIDLKSWRQAVAYIPQRPQILDGTLRDNLLYGLPPAEAALVTDEELLAFMDRFRINFDKRLVDGVHTRVGKHGMQLSGGQAQRVMIGAAVLKKPRFMIIDEATSSLDAGSQHDVQEALYELLRQTNAGALIIAHRLSTLRNCDKFVVLQPAESDSAMPQVEAVAYSLTELYLISPTFRKLADLEGVTFT